MYFTIMSVEFAIALHFITTKEELHICAAKHACQFEHNPGHFHQTSASSSSQLHVNIYNFTVITEFPAYQCSLFIISVQAYSKLSLSLLINLSGCKWLYVACSLCNTLHLAWESPQTLWGSRIHCCGEDSWLWWPLHSLQTCDGNDNCCWLLLLSVWLVPRYC